MADDEDEGAEGCTGQVRRWAKEEWRDTPWKTIWKALLAELIGTFLLTLFGCSAAVSTDNLGWTHMDTSPDRFSYGDTYHVVVSLAFGLTTAADVAMFQTLSGSHVNPAVTLSYMASRRMGLFAGLLYIPVQFFGGAAGAAILQVMKGKMNNRDDVFPATVYLQYGMHMWQGIVWEIILAFHLCTVYLVVTDDCFPFMRFTSPLLIGICVIVNHLAALYATGGTANPARALGAGIISRELENVWVFLLGPPIGAVLAALFYIFLLKEEEQERETRKISIFRRN